jgi:hypothetical protein
VVANNSIIGPAIGITIPRSYISAIDNTIINNTFYNSSVTDLEFYYGPNNVVSNNFVSPRSNYTIKILNTGSFSINAIGNFYQSSRDN